MKIWGRSTTERRKNQDKDPEVSETHVIGAELRTRD